MMVFELLGGLGLFLFGMRVMSAGLQKAAGDRMRSLLASFTKNRFAGAFSGFMMTCSLQSSSATTDMSGLRRAAKMAVAKPAAPAPITATSTDSVAESLTTPRLYALDGYAPSTTLPLRWTPGFPACTFAPPSVD